MDDEFITIEAKWGKDFVEMQIPDCFGEIFRVYHDSTWRKKDEDGVTLKSSLHPVSLKEPSEYKLSKESLEDVVFEREWQGLTPEELREIIGISSADSDWNVLKVMNWAFDIEAKLREKNKIQDPLPLVKLDEFLKLIEGKEDFIGIPTMRTEWPTRENK